MHSMLLLVYFSAIKCSAEATTSVKVLRFFRYLPSCIPAERDESAFEKACWHCSPFLPLPSKSRKGS